MRPFLARALCHHDQCFGKRTKKRPHCACSPPVLLVPNQFAGVASRCVPGTGAGIKPCILCGKKVCQSGEKAVGALRGRRHVCLRVPFAAANVATNRLLFGAPHALFCTVWRHCGTFVALWCVGACALVWSACAVSVLRWSSGASPQTIAMTHTATHRKDSRMGTWCSGITSASHAEGPGFNPQCVQFVLLAGLGCRGACCSAPLWAVCRLPPPGGGCKSAAAS